MAEEDESGHWFIKLHRKTEELGKGSKVIGHTWNEMWLNPRTFVSIMKHPETGETWVHAGNVPHVVRESVEEVLRIIGERPLAKEVRRAITKATSQGGIA